MTYRNIIPQESLKEISQKERKKVFDIFGYFRKAWELIREDFSAYFLFSFMGTAIIISLLIIPLIGYLVYYPAGYILYSGIYLFTYKKKYHHESNFGSFFDGIQFIGPLLKVYGIYFFFCLIFSLPLLAYGFLTTDWLTQYPFENTNENIVSILIVFSLFLCIYLSITFIFAPLFIFFGRMDASTAIEYSRKLVHKHFFQVLLFYIFQNILLALGMLLACVGFFIAIPITHVAAYLAFEDILDLKIQQNETDEILRHLI